MVGNSYSPSPSSRAQEALEEAGARIKDRIAVLRNGRPPARKDAVRTALLLAMVVVAGTLLFVIPEPDEDPVEAYALQANSDGTAEPDSPTTNQEVGERPSSTFEVSDASESRQVRSWLAAMSGSEAADELSAISFSRRTTTTEAPATTEAPSTTAPSTTAAPTTPPPTTAPSTEATESVDTTDETAPADTTDTTMPADGDTTDQNETTETTEAPTTTAAPTTAPPTTAAGNGYVDAGHGVFVPPILLQIRWCESTDNYTAANPYSSARGAYQFLTGSWAGYGHAARYGVSQAHLATPAQQDEAALLTWQRDGTRPWLASKHCWG